MNCGYDPRDFYVHRCGTGDSTPQSGMHALVIGTSQYRYRHCGNSIYERFRDIPDPVFGAGKFAKFLRDKYRDPLGRKIATVRLLLTSASDEEPALSKLDVTWQPATYVGACTALRE